MKAGKFITAAALMLASLGAGTAASARDHGYDNRGHYSQRHDDRGYRGHRGYDNRRYYGHRQDRRWSNGRHDRRCWTEWRHHRQVRVCR